MKVAETKKTGTKKTTKKTTTKKETNNVFRNFDYDNIPIVDLVNEMITDAFEKRASDIHFDPTPDVLKVRIRIDGVLIPYAEVPEIVKKNLSTRIKIIAGMNITETRLPQDGAIKMEFDGKPIDMRVSSLPIVDGEKIVIRILDYSRSLEGLEALGFTEENLKTIYNILKVPNGIILVTGATGSGKSTTVYSMLQKLNKTSTNIITVEDPVEMKIAGLNQVQVMSDIGLTFANTLRSILRQDPDIIMIGEIRDDETARIAVRASITGHLVLSTIHTNNSLNTIERLLDMDVERYLLGTALTGIVSQRLTKRLCPKCRRRIKTTEYEKIVFKKALGEDVDEIYEPVGCPDCIGGYIGRIPIHEVLELNQEIRDAIVNNIRKDELRELVYKKTKVKSLLEDGLFKVLNGDTSFEEVLRVIDVEEDFGEADTELKNAILGKIQEDDAKKKPEVKDDEIEEENETLDDNEDGNETLNDDTETEENDDILNDESNEVLNEENTINAEETLSYEVALADDESFSEQEKTDYEVL